MVDYYLTISNDVRALRSASPARRDEVYDRARLTYPTGADREALEHAIARVETELAGEAAGRPPSSDRRRLAVNAAAGGAANAVKICIQLVLLPVMAHLLGPAEFGLYALALPTVNFFSVLADGGLGNSLAREHEASTLVWSTAFWVLLATGFALALIVTGWGFVLAMLAHEPRLSGLMAFLSISFVLITMSVLPSARLTRRGNLVVYAGADLTSTIIGASLAVALAVAGMGAWSLAAQFVVAYFIRAVILNAAAFYRPAFTFRLSVLGQHISTGGAVLGSRLFDFAGRLTENLVIGRTFGAAALGTYTLANQAPRFICEAAQNPVWAALYAHALHADVKEMALLYSKLVRLLAAALFPVAFLLSASAPDIVKATLGDKWASAAVLIQILTPFYALNAAAAQGGAILLANGRNAATFWLLAGGSVGRLLAVCTVHWTGLTGVAWGIGLSYVVFSGAMFLVSGRVGGSSAWTVVEGMIPPLFASVAAGLVCFALLKLHPAGLGWIALSLVTGGVAYLAALMALEGRRLRADLAALRRLASRRRDVESAPVEG